MMHFNNLINIWNNTNNNNQNDNNDNKSNESNESLFVKRYLTHPNTIFDDIFVK